MSKNTGGAVAVVGIGLLALIAAVPQAIWVGIGGAVAVGFVIFLAVKALRSTPKGAPPAGRRWSADEPQPAPAC
jgi:hypothetical protein